MAGKRSNGEGSITQRADGRWEARLTLPNGKRKSFYAATHTEARRKLTSARRDLDTGLPVVGERQTVAAYLAHWQKTIAPTIKESTQIRYDDGVRLHIVPTLGKVILPRLTAQQIQALYAAKLAEGLSPTTVSHLHAVLHSALDDAVRLGLVPRNVADLVTPPRPAHYEMQVLDATQAQKLLGAAHGDRLEALYVVAVTTGARLGELLGLRWADIDLERGTLHIRYTLRFAKGYAWRLTPPKTAKSRRRIQLTPTAITALRSHRVRQAEERLALGEAWADLDFVFTRADGEPLRGTHVLERSFRPLLKRAGLPSIRLHDLRHTAATLMLLQNVPAKVVSDLLGHSSIAITLDRYSHVLPSMQENAAAAMERLLTVAR